MKYIFEITIATKIVGAIHGALFALFCILLIRAYRESK